MAEFFHFNLWMFLVIGVLGFAICYLRARFIWWVLPIIVLISVIYFLNLAEYQTGIGPPNRPDVINIVVSVLFALVLPLLGTFLGRLPKKTVTRETRNKTKTFSLL